MLIISQDISWSIKKDHTKYPVYDKALSYKKKGFLLKWLKKKKTLQSRHFCHLFTVNSFKKLNEQAERFLEKPNSSQRDKKKISKRGSFQMDFFPFDQALKATNCEHPLSLKISSGKKFLKVIYHSEFDKKSRESTDKKAHTPYFFRKHKVSKARLCLSHRSHRNSHRILTLNFFNVPLSEIFFVSILHFKN